MTRDSSLVITVACGGGAMGAVQVLGVSVLFQMFFKHKFGDVHTRGREVSMQPPHASALPTAQAAAEQPTPTLNHIRVKSYATCHEHIAHLSSPRTNVRIARCDECHFAATRPSQFLHLQITAATPRAFTSTSLLRLLIFLQYFP